MGRERGREVFDVEAFRRYAWKIATGSDKTTVTGMCRNFGAAQYMQCWTQPPGRAEMPSMRSDNEVTR
jgi:hypothetical protein